MARDTERFKAALRIGQVRVAEGISDMEVVSGMLRRFGVAVNEFTGGLVGVACVTRDGHRAIEAEFVPGIPLSIVIVAHEAPERPMPIVGGLLVAEGGFPVEMIVGERTIVAHGEDGFEAGLSALAASGHFASAVAEILSADPSSLRQLQLQS